MQLLLAILQLLTNHKTKLNGLLLFSFLLTATACSPLQHYNYLPHPLASQNNDKAYTSTNPQIEKINDTRVKLGLLQDEINHLESQLLPKDYMDQTLYYLDRNSQTLYNPLPETAMLASEELKYLEQESRRNNYNSAIINEQKMLITNIQMLKQQQITLYEYYIDLVEQYKRGK